MKYSINRDQTGNFFLIATEGDFDLADFLGMADRLMSDANWRPGTNCIFDYRKTDFLSVDNKDLEEVSKRHKRDNSILGSGKSALVMKCIGNFGMGRLYQGMTEMEVDTEFKIFTDFDKALEWIQEEGRAP